MPQYNTTAIVLRRIHFGETDNILTLYSKERGRISAIAKGARKPLSRLSGATDPLNCSRFALASGKSLEVVAQAEMIDSFPGLHVSVERLAHAQYFAELLSAFTVEDDPHPALFQLLLRALRLLEKGEPEMIARWYEINLLGELGYAPNLIECAVCHAELPGDFSQDSVFGLSASLGSALCAMHAHPSDQPDHSALSYGALSSLQAVENVAEKASAVLALTLSDSKSDSQARAALRRHIRYRLDRDLKSVEFLDSLRF